MIWVVSLLAMKLISHSLTATQHVFGIRSLIGFGKLVGPLAQSVLYPRYTNVTLPLKAFRREPDISEFDWTFTPSHDSSKHGSSYAGSVLQCVISQREAGHG